MIFLLLVLINSSVYASEELDPKLAFFTAGSLAAGMAEARIAKLKIKQKKVLEPHLTEEIADVYLARLGLDNARQDLRAGPKRFDSMLQIQKAKTELRRTKTELEGRIFLLGIEDPKAEKIAKKIFRTKIIGRSISAALMAPAAGLAVFESLPENNSIVVPEK